MCNVINQFAAQAAVLTSCAERKGADGIICVLETVVDILTIGVGLFAVIAIVIVGIQYMTAGGNEEQTRKAKRRIFEIVIGVAAYVVMYALLKWLGFSQN